VGWATYHDQWLSEGFADFSAALFVQFTEKPDKFEQFWERSRKMILEKNQYGHSANDAGPLWMGIRLNTFRTGSAYRKLVYPKGGYILHMLREMMFDDKAGDHDFIEMMHDFVKTNTGKNASTEDFCAAINRHMRKDLDLEGSGRADWFIREWVYGSEVPSYRLEYSLTQADQGKILFTGKLTQSGVSNGFRMRVPVYLDFDGKVVRLGSIGVHGSQTTPEFKALLPKKPKRVLLNAHHDVLAAEAIVAEN
jgi:aminopeptidase N